MNLRIAAISLTIAATATLSAQSLLPDTTGCRARYAVSIDFGKSYLSGICAMLRTDDALVASVVNEFGVSLLDFTYSHKNNKVKLGELTPKLNKWYIRRTLRSDLRHLLGGLSQGDTVYENTRRHIRYSFVPITVTDTISHAATE